MRFKSISIARIFALNAVCVICHQTHAKAEAVCASCFSLFPQLGPACQFCAHPLTDSSFLICGQCILVKPWFDRTFIRFRFEDPLRRLVHNYKYKGELFLRGVLIKLMMEAIADSEFTTQCLVPVPLHPKRLKERGFNQSAELAKALAKQLKIPYALTLCQKILHTPTQVSLSAKERQNNLSQAFNIKKNPYKDITLVDDLLTTGNTVNELAKLFKEQGATQVKVWCCARTIATAARLGTT